MSQSQVQCDIIKHDGLNLINNIDIVYGDAERADRVVIAMFSNEATVTNDEIDNDNGRDSSTQHSRIRVSVYFNEAIARNLSNSPFGYHIQCRGATPEAMELLSSETYLIQVYEFVEEQAGKKYYDSIASTSSAKLESSRASLLSSSIALTQSSYSSGDIGQVNLIIGSIETEVHIGDVIEVLFPASSTYDFNIPFHGTNEDEDRNVDDSNNMIKETDISISSCQVYVLAPFAGDEEEKLLLSSDYIISIGSVSLFQSTVTAASAQATLLGPQPLVLSIRLSPISQNANEESLLAIGSSIRLHCMDVGLPVAVDEQDVLAVENISISLYRSLQQEVGLQEKVDTLLVRRAYNDDISPPFIGPQKFKSVRFFILTPEDFPVVNIMVELQISRAIHLGTTFAPIALHLQLPERWTFSKSSSCRISIGSDSHAIDGVSEFTIYEQGGDSLTSLSRASVVFRFKSPPSVLLYQNPLYLQCDSVVLPVSPLSLSLPSTTLTSPSSLPLQDISVLEYELVNVASYLAPDSDRSSKIFAETLDARSPIISNSLVVTHREVISVSHEFTSGRSFLASEIENWKEMFRTVSSIPTHLLDTAPTVSVRSLHQRPKENAGNTLVTITAEVTSSRPWLDINDLLVKLQSTHQEAKTHVFFSTYYNMGQFSSAMEKAIVPVDCFNRIVDFDGIETFESDIDCGGKSCTPCTVGQSCFSNIDCLSQKCVSNICLDSASDTNKATSLLALMIVVLSFILFNF